MGRKNVKMYQSQNILWIFQNNPQNLSQYSTLSPKLIVAFFQPHPNALISNLVHATRVFSR